MKEYQKKKSKRGITLVALVITVIIIIILATVTINMAFGNNSLIKRAENATLKYDEESSKEQLEMVLAGLLIDKKNKSEYNEQDYINQEILKNNMQITGNTVIVNGWQFLIDRIELKIVESLGKSQKDDSIVIEVSSETNSDKSICTIVATIIYEGTITEISIGGEKIPVPEKIDGKYTITKEVIKNGTYSIIVKSEDNKYQIKDYETNEIIPSISKIKTKEDLQQFSESVNAGRTYEGIEVELMGNIDLQGDENNQWNPIGKISEDEKIPFKGTFDGNGFEIQNLYINDSNKSNVALFAKVDGTVQNLTVKGEIKAKELAAGIAAECDGTIRRCISDVDIEVEKNHAGGISISPKGTVEECINKGNITSFIYYGGGITSSLTGGTIRNCYNLGNIINTSKYQNGDGTVGGILAGIDDRQYVATVENCYNAGTVKSNITGPAGGTIGFPVWRGTSNISKLINVGDVYVGNNKATTDFGIGQYGAGKIFGRDAGSVAKNCKALTLDELKNYSNEELNVVLGIEFVKDENNINNGLPILKWQTEI